MAALAGASSPRMRSEILIVLLGAVAWGVLTLAVVRLADGYLPFDRPALRFMPFWQQIAMPSVGLIEQLALMGMVFLLTRRRAVVMAERAPARLRALGEAVALLAYAMLAQAGGWVIGPAFGYRPFSFHLAGTLVGCTTLASPGEAILWASYNFVMFAVVPYVWFRGRYTNLQLNLKSTNLTNDWLVLLAVFAVEGAVELATFPGLFQMSRHALMLAAPLSFTIFLFGTVLPTMVLIYAILLPRYLRVTGSHAATVILGGLTYAAMHLVEGWSSFDTPRHVALSLLFVFLQYAGPGMFKSFVTLRTGNAWIHALGYHAIAPHTIVDAPMIAKVFGIK